MKSSGVDEGEKLSMQQELWGLNHAECLKEQEEMMIRFTNFDSLYMEMEMEMERDEEEMKKMEEETRGRLPNTYPFTKHLPGNRLLVKFNIIIYLLAKILIDKNSIICNYLPGKCLPR
ncbi:hypothetical protein Ccrd_014552 [Cynara cardunculus var. scolymus]|uniref:Uncharacterized protein n=1 Tax=Cynara cardunculus var. scolymus TaxID=59895 RepID=A0A103YDG9_CYNCS|nr:hypothetical protein Ccrd_014552 [Cynara cardunculus var. scolymus]